MGQAVAFWIMAVIMVVAAFGVVFLHNIFRGALSLILCFIAVAGVYITLSADFRFDYFSDYDDAEHPAGQPIQQAGTTRRYPGDGAAGNHRLRGDRIALEYFNTGAAGRYYRAAGNQAL
jgi:hypothetical protein